MKKKEMIKQLEDMKDGLLNRYGFIDLTFYNFTEIQSNMTDPHKEEVVNYIDKQFQMYRDSWLIPVIDNLLEELKK